MLTIATNYFDLKPDNNLQVLIDDGIVFLDKSAEKGELQYFEFNKIPLLKLNIFRSKI